MISHSSPSSSFSTRGLYRQNSARTTAIQRMFDKEDTDEATR